MRDLLKHRGATGRCTQSMAWPEVHWAVDGRRRTRALVRKRFHNNPPIDDRLLETNVREGGTKTVWNGINIITDLG